MHLGRHHGGRRWRGGSLIKSCMYMTKAFFSSRSLWPFSTDPVPHVAFLTCVPFCFRAGQSIRALISARFSSSASLWILCAGAKQAIVGHGCLPVAYPQVAIFEHQPRASRLKTPPGLVDFSKVRNQQRPHIGLVPHVSFDACHSSGRHHLRVSQNPMRDLPAAVPFPGKRPAYCPFLVRLGDAMDGDGDREAADLWTSGKGRRSSQKLALRS